MGPAGDPAGEEGGRSLSASPPARLLIYGRYCSHVETAIGALDELCKDREDIRMKLEVRAPPRRFRSASGGSAPPGARPRQLQLRRWRRFKCAGRAELVFTEQRLLLQECSKRANYGKFTLRDLLVVPMQRVLKYHLLLQVRASSSRPVMKPKVYSPPSFLLKP